MARVLEDYKDQPMDAAAYNSSVVIMLIGVGIFMLLCGLAIALGYRKCRKKKKREEDYRVSDAGMPFGSGVSADGLEMGGIGKYKTNGRWVEEDESEDSPPKELDPETRRKI